MTESEMMREYGVEFALKEVDDLLASIRSSQVVSQSRVVNSLLDIRNLLTGVLHPSGN